MRVAEGTWTSLQLLELLDDNKSMTSCVDSSPLSVITLEHTGVGTKGVPGTVVVVVVVDSCAERVKV